MDSFQNINHNFDGFGASPDGLGATVRMGGFGDDLPVSQPVEQFTENPAAKTFKLIWATAGLAGTAIGAYHGYKRNDSVGWAIVWALLGGLAPIIVIPVAFAQGIGDPK
jgi:hypothetical protein